MGHRVPGRVAVAAAVSTATCLGGAVVAAATGTRGWLAGGAALASIPHALLLVHAPARSVRAALAVGAVVGLVLVGLDPPLLSDDVFRYLWDGRVLRAGLSPFRLAPSDPELAPLRDALWQRINHPDIATIYPPGAQAAFAAVGAVWHGPAAFRLLALGAHLGGAAVAAGAVRAEDAPRVAWAVALQPLALIESAGSGHLDAAVGLALVAAATSLDRGRPVTATVAAASAAALKLVGLLVVPALWRSRRSAAVVVLAVAVVSVAILAGAGSGSRQPGGLTQYTTRWRGNAGLFSLVEGGVGRGLTRFREGELVGLPWGGRVTVPAPLRGGPWDLSRTVRSEKKEPLEGLPFDRVVGLVSRGLALCLALVVAAIAAWRAPSRVLAVRAALWATLLLSPQVHPWYLLWLLPLEAVAGRAAGFVWAAAVLGSYAAADAWAVGRVWADAPGFVVAEYVVVLTTLSLEAVGPYRQGTHLPGLTDRTARH